MVVIDENRSESGLESGSEVESQVIPGHEITQVSGFFGFETISKRSCDLDSSMVSEGILVDESKDSESSISLRADSSANSISVNSNGSNYYHEEVEGDSDDAESCAQSTTSSDHHNDGSDNIGKRYRTNPILVVGRKYFKTPFERTPKRTNLIRVIPERNSRNSIRVTQTPKSFLSGRGRDMLGPILPQRSVGGETGAGRCGDRNGNSSNGSDERSDSSSENSAASTTSYEVQEHDIQRYEGPDVEETKSESKSEFQCELPRDFEGELPSPVISLETFQDKSTTAFSDRNTIALEKLVYSEEKNDENNVSLEDARKDKRKKKQNGLLNFGFKKIKNVGSNVGSLVFFSRRRATSYGSRDSVPDMSEKNFSIYENITLKKWEQLVALKGKTKVEEEYIAYVREGIRRELEGMHQKQSREGLHHQKQGREGLHHQKEGREGLHHQKQGREGLRHQRRERVYQEGAGSALNDPLESSLEDPVQGHMIKCLGLQSPKCLGLQSPLNRSSMKKSPASWKSIEKQVPDPLSFETDTSLLETEGFLDAQISTTITSTPQRKKSLIAKLMKNPFKKLRSNLGRSL